MQIYRQVDYFYASLIVQSGVVTTAVQSFYGHNYTFEKKIAMRCADVFYLIGLFVRVMLRLLKTSRDLLVRGSNCWKLGNALEQSTIWLWGLIVLTVHATAQPVIISEFVASNQTGRADEDGDRNDWIEIYNTTNQEALLSGWFLTDDAEDLTQWEFPAITLPAESSIIVYASGKDRSVAGSELHTNFKLSKEGGFLGLVQDDRKTIAHAYDPEYPIQLPDVSYGIGMQLDKTVFVANDAPGRLHIPKSDGIGSDWTLPDFDDSPWQEVAFGIGYIRDSENDDSPHDPGNIGEGTGLLADVTLTTDALEPTSFLSPVGEGVDLAIDNNTDTKYLNFDKLNAGFTVQLSRGAVAVTGLRLTSANDAPDRDPTSFLLSGSNNGASFREIARGSVPFFENRHETVQIDFNNESAFSYYRLVFPTVRDAEVAVAMQIAEVELLGRVPKGEAGGPGDPTPSGTVDLSQFVDISDPEDLIDPTTANSPGNEEVWRAIDNITQTKYLNFDGPGSGFTVKPTVGLTVIEGLRLTSANDAPGRDPASFLLEGSQNGTDFDRIAQGELPTFEDRFTTVEVAFANNKSYEYYRLTFPTLRGGNGQLMQIAEVEFLGNVGLPQPEFEELIHTNLESSMFGLHTTALARWPFTVAEGEDLQGLSLNVRYDDGFIAYLNGIEVARGNVPMAPGFDAVALSDRNPKDAEVAERFDLDSFQHSMRTGENVLAVHALNDDASSPDFLLSVQLESSVTRIDLSEKGYFDIPSPGKQNPLAQTGLVPAPVMDAESGFKDAAFHVAIHSNLEGARIYYSTDGGTPDELTGIPYTNPVHVTGTTILRAAAFLEGWRPSPLSTRTYLFTGDIAQQNANSKMVSGFPDRWGGQMADYGMDPRVVGQNGRDDYGRRYTRSIQDDLRSIPSLSLVMETDDLFGSKGIYSNPTAHGAAWEKPVSIEWIDPDHRDGFQVNAGIRVQGGAFRRFDLSLKKSFRLVFRSQYGPSELKFPLFGPDAADSFDNVVLRANGNDAWRYGGDRALYIRDAFAMETARDMGMVSSHTTFVHLYLNGAYWGLYNLTERPDASFSSSYHGGDKDDWDALNQDSVPDGTREAWDRMLAVLNEGIDQKPVYQKIQGRNPDGMRDPSIENLLDIENLIDYCILNFYIGNQDWPGRNYWVGRNRKGDEGFQFYPWDSETAMGLGSGLTANVTGANSAVARPYGALRANADFRRWFGDRAQHHFSQGGALYVNQAKPQWSGIEPENNRPAARFEGLADLIDRAIVGETARWGDQLNNIPYTRDEHWRRERDELLKNYFPRRSAIVMEQLRQAGLYPQINAPVFNLPAGRIEPGTSLMMSTDHGTIYYTLDGSDPRTEVKVSTVKPSTLIDSNTQRRVWIPSPDNGGNTLSTRWRMELDFPDNNWTSATGGVGYDTGTGYQSLIGIDVRTAMYGQNGSAFIRIPFTTAPEAIADLNFMILRVRYDDGFIAYLNGVQIASANAPGDPQWDALATGANDDAAAIFWQEFETSAFLERLRPGNNLLAIQGLNVSLDSTDFLIDVELMAGKRNITGNLPTSNRYDSPISLQDLTTIKASTLSGSEWSALSEATYIVGEPRLQVSELHYHPANPSREEMAAGFDDADDFEFLELYNPGTATFLLGGVRFVDGVTFDFTDSGITRLAPGSTVLIVKNRIAFEMRYGPGLPVAGEYAGNFSNSGESVIVLDSEDRILVAFSYDDADPELKTADGNGPSLVAVELDGDPPDGSRWKTSKQIGGSPGDHPETITDEILHSKVSLEKGNVYIEYQVSQNGTYDLYESQDLRRKPWNLLSSDVRPEADGKIVFEIEVAEDIPTRFFQLKLLIPAPQN